MREADEVQSEQIPLSRKRTTLLNFEVNNIIVELQDHYYKQYQIQLVLSRLNFSLANNQRVYSQAVDGIRMFSVLDLMPNQQYFNKDKYVWTETDTLSVNFGFDGVQVFQECDEMSQLVLKLDGLSFCFDK